MMEVSIGVKDDIENEENRLTKEDVNPLIDNSSNKTRSNKRKRDREDSPDGIHLMTDVA